MTLRPLAAILAALVLLAAPCALAQAPAAAPAPATTAAAPAPATEAAPATTEARRPGHDRGRRSGPGHRGRPRARRRPGPLARGPRRHLPDDDDRHRPDRPPPPDRPRHPGHEEAGIGEGLRRDRPGTENETDQSTGEGGEPSHGGGSHGGLLRAADPLPTSLRPGGAPARTPRFARQTRARASPRPVLAKPSGSPAVLGGRSRDPPPGLGRPGREGPRSTPNGNLLSGLEGGETQGPNNAEEMRSPHRAFGGCRCRGKCRAQTSPFCWAASDRTAGSKRTGGASRERRPSTRGDPHDFASRPPDQARALFDERSEEFARAPAARAAESMRVARAQEPPWDAPPGRGSCGTME